MGEHVSCISMKSGGGWLGCIDGDVGHTTIIEIDTGLTLQFWKGTDDLTVMRGDRGCNG